MNAEGSLRQRHARRLLDAVHPAHLGDLPGSLLERARLSSVGRRHLALVALRVAPDVFAPDHERWEPWQKDEAWLRWPRARLQAFTLELGAAALGPAFRMLVERNAVLFARNALGMDTWRRALGAAPWSGEPPEAVRHMGVAVLERVGRDPQALRDQVIHRGKVEFIGHAERRHESLAARLALAYASLPGRPCKADCWLPATAVPSLLAEQAAQDADASDAAIEREGQAE